MAGILKILVGIRRNWWENGKFVGDSHHFWRVIFTTTRHLLQVREVKISKNWRLHKPPT